MEIKRTWVDRFSLFCKKKGLTLLTSQHCYISALFEDDFVRGQDRGTGKTLLAEYLVAFNEEEKLWKINYHTNTMHYGEQVRHDIEQLIGIKLSHCKFIYPNDKHVPTSSMTINDGKYFTIEAKLSREWWR